MRKDKLLDEEGNEMDEKKLLEQWASQGLSNEEIGSRLGLSEPTIRRRLKKYGIEKPAHKRVLQSTTVKEDREQRHAKEEENLLKKKYEVSLEEIELLETGLATALNIGKRIKLTKIRTPNRSKKQHFGTIVAVASDWHIEETIRPETIAGVSNHYDLKESRRRAEKFFTTTLRLAEIERQNLNIDTIVVACLGDFISSNIHDELLETCSLRPAEAIVRATEYLTDGFQYLLDNSDYKIVVQCHTGNHGRITKKVHVSTEYGNSLETIMYLWLDAHFKNNERITFNIPQSYHSYLDIYGKLVRFHHGHAIRGGQGIGGIASPILRKIAKWDTTRRADHDIFGHFHQFFDGGKFFVNGSLIGYSPYAVQIGASAEPPAQGFIVFSSKYGKIATRQILFE